MTLAALALRRPVTTVAATLALVLLGSVSLGRLPVALLPDVGLPVLTVRTAYTGAAAAEVSRLVAEPIEEAVAATPGLVELRSVSRNGGATTMLRFAWGTRMPATVLQVRERLDNARSALPAEAERPTLLSDRGGYALEPPVAARKEAFTYATLTGLGGPERVNAQEWLAEHEAGGATSPLN